MNEDTTILPFRQLEKINNPLTEIAREGVPRMLAEMLKAEADAFVATFADERLAAGRQRTVRHGFGPAVLDRNVRSRPGLARWMCSVPSCATVWRVLIPPQKSVLPRAYCRNGRGALSAWMRCCLSWI